MSLVDISSGESSIPLWVTVTVTPSGIKKVVEEKRLIRNKYRIACPRLCNSTIQITSLCVLNLFL